jgi:hypothetical protein
LTQILVSTKFEKEIVFESSVLVWIRNWIRIEPQPCGAGCKIHHPRPKGVHGQHHIPQDSAGQIDELVLEKKITNFAAGDGFFYWNNALSTPLPLCRMYRGDEHLDHLTTTLFAGPSASRMFCVPEDDFRAGGHLNGLGDLPEDLRWGASNYHQKGVRCRVTVVEGAARKKRLDWG